MHKSLKIIVGLLIMLVGAWTYIQWPGNLAALWSVLKGTFGLFVVFIGFIFLLVGFTE